MYFLANKVTIAATPTKVVTLPPNPGGGVVVTNTGSNPAYLGGAAVTSATGFLLAAGASVTLPTGSNQATLVAVAPASTTLSYIASVG